VENRDKKRRILILCPYPYDKAAGQRLKYEQYLSNWQKSGFEITLSSYMSDSLWSVAYKKGNFFKKVQGIFRGHFLRFLDIFRIKNFDIVYVFQWTTPFGTHLYDIVIRKLAKKIVFDLEDLVTLSEKESSHESSNKLLTLLRSKRKTEFLVKNSDHVITSSNYLNELCIKLNKNSSSTFISSSVDTNKFLPINNYTNDKIIKIGWTGTFSSKAYLDLLVPVFTKLKKRNNFRVKVISNFDYEIHGIDCETVYWTKKKEVEDLQEIDIGVYPLEDNQWVLGKSGLKAIQYMAFGIPTVASNVGSNSEIITHLENGWLVNTEEEWLKALETLINEPALRKRLGKNARKTVQERYSLDTIGSKYLNILNEQVNGK
jgi:glycosyltransferase involved in cell wall biosynthesis